SKISNLDLPGTGFFPISPFSLFLFHFSSSPLKTTSKINSCLPPHPKSKPPLLPPSGTTASSVGCHHCFLRRPPSPTASSVGHHHPLLLPPKIKPLLFYFKMVGRGRGRSRKDKRPIDHDDGATPTLPSTPHLHPSAADGRQQSSRHRSILPYPSTHHTTHHSPAQQYYHHFPP
uniref:Uncharacterized protein n=1 Tax=Nicotiana tabacum TaxID=4097 RepID=A0A1S4BV73_TOBAC